jgi:hypothetical protein
MANKSETMPEGYGYGSEVAAPTSAAKAYAKLSPKQKRRKLAAKRIRRKKKGKKVIPKPEVQAPSAEEIQATENVK